VDRGLKAGLEARFGERLTGPIRQRHDETEIRIGPGDVIGVMTALHDEPAFGFRVLADLAGVDTGRTMQVVYHLWSVTTPDWLRVIVDGLSRDDPRVPSVTYLWKGAEWLEREAYDMFGITFEGNRDLRRIFMPPDYESFPLRKDFYLADDAARSPGAGVRHMERTHTPAGDARVRQARS
jgi:NADH-quinone oxidoreductase subunit C